MVPPTGRSSGRVIGVKMARRDSGNSSGEQQEVRGVKPLYQTERISNCLIPMSDGVTMAANLYRPLVDEPVPALISYTPYHKDGWFALV